MPLSNPDASFAIQLLGAGVIFLWVFATSLTVWALLRAVMGIRVSEAEEAEGVDIAECGLQAYPEFTSTDASMVDTGGDNPNRRQLAQAQLADQH